VEAPGAFIMGCHARHKSKIQRVVMQMDEVDIILTVFPRLSFVVVFVDDIVVAFT